MRTGFLLLVFTLGAIPAHAQGTIQGRVVDAGGNNLPGIDIRVTGRDHSATVVTSVAGTYEVRDLAPGRYSVRATLPGFCPRQRDDVLVATGRSTNVDFTLLVAGGEGDLWVAWSDVRSQWTDADVAVHLRIRDAMETKRWPAPTCGFILCTQYSATVLAAVPRRSTGSVSPGKFTFLQDYGGIEEWAYARESEYVAFLTWNAASSTYMRTAGPSSLLPVRDGRIVTRLSQDREFEGMKVEDFLSRLRALANEQR